MTHGDDQFCALPGPLPEGERVIWKGRPTYKGLAIRSFHIREVLIYFGLLMVWKIWSNASQGMSPWDAVIAILPLIVPLVSGVGLLALLAWLFRRATCYTITSERVLLQFGVALPTTMNIPLSKIANAALKTFGDGSGDIPLQLADSKRVSYVMLWPNIRSWRLKWPEPMLASIPDAAGVAAKLSEALADHHGRAGKFHVQINSSEPSTDSVGNSSSTVAA